jgi:23S rRNA (uracil1939-C5)-methyltransferase
MPSVVGELEVPLDAFYQVNGAVADLLIKRVTSEIMATTPKALIDLYCGVGGFALAAAQAGVARTLGVESGSQAVEAARRNAARIGTNSEFANLDAAEGLHAALGEVGAEGVCVVLDPPRKGLDSHVLDLLIEARPSTIIYVSCAPDMLARDLVTLQQRGGYSFASGALLDMFPRTAHFETVTTLRSANH